MKRKIVLPVIFLMYSFLLIAQQPPADKNALPQTIKLYNNLKKTLDAGIMFGHQDALAYGVNWKYVPGNSDIKMVTGDYPAVFGWELGNLELDSTQNLDGVPFKNMQQYIQQGHQMGGVITISWHLNNPLTGKSAWDPAPGTVAAILPGGSKHTLYLSWLDKVADFLLQLTDTKGKLIPVIFRPFHELNGSWFWWGKNHCSPQELVALYKFTVDYFRQQKNIHHLLYAFNTDRFATTEEYLERYPGNDYVDVIGFDIYQRNEGNKLFVKEIDRQLTLLENIATTNNKIPALTEFGYGNLPDSTWWTEVFWRGVGHHKISYTLAWRNAGKKANGDTEFYVPYNGQASAQNFRHLYAKKQTLFAKDVAAKKLYK
ncbi:MAG: hypothetical protein RL172_2901 [Bacteroidota bacterium]|jgi:hypothetical protein